MDKNIELWDGLKDDGLSVVRINFSTPAEWCVFTVEELLQILRLWIEGEEIKYPPEKGFKGRRMLKEKIDDVFNEKIGGGTTNVGN